ncbi:MAG TPA: diguanylate cyclase [Terracidiphilus sp.]|jgi:diguanylate cyclase (GGDEF)-like protein|nr:diguanylate cyclase [Terracidiphilus sp.]
MYALAINLKKHCFGLLFIACAASLIVQAISLVARPPHVVLSNLLIGLMGAFATLGCLWAARRYRPARKLWLLLGSGFLISVVGQILATYYEVSTGNSTQSTAINFDFLFFAYGIPILLAVCSGSNEEGLKSLLWLDTAQATIAATLTYVQIFSALPAFGGRVPISATQLMYLYNVENWILAGAVTVRLISNPLPGKKRFYENLAVYLWVYAIVALVNGYLELGRSLPDGLQDAAWGLPYLIFLGTLTFRRENQQTLRTEVRKRRTLALLVDNLSPLLFTLAIVLMGVTVAVVHKALAFVCIATVVLLYGIRAALLHGKYARSQEELTKAATALLEANDQLLALSIRDSLTGIYNRRHFDEALLMEWNRSRRIRQTLSLLMIDVDCFKALNDRYGHQTGDDCLRTIATEIATHLKRPDDLVARYGGEEFAVILPGANRAGALSVAEGIRIAIERVSLTNEDSVVSRVVTVSVGISTEENFIEADARALLKRADAALYEAKSQGRNQCRAPQILDLPVKPGSGGRPSESSCTLV